MSITKLQLLATRLEAVLHQYRHHSAPLASPYLRSEIATKCAQEARNVFSPKPNKEPK